jgi:hypothetical protein
MSSVFRAIGSLFAGPPPPPPPVAAPAAPPSMATQAVPAAGMAQQQTQEAGAYSGTLKTKDTETGGLGAPKPPTTAGAENLGAGSP